MLRSVYDLKNLSVQASDGSIGHVSDLCFDDDTWDVRYFVVATGTWLVRSKVLIYALAAGVPDWNAGTLPLALSREQIENSPDIDTDRPVSRQHERQHLDYYCYPHYWRRARTCDSGLIPSSTLPGAVSFPTDSNYQPSLADRFRAAAACAGDQNNDPHLRSCQAMVGYDIHAIHGDIGRLEGMLVEEQTWAVRYIIVSTSSWWLGHQVLIAPQWIEDVSWSEKSVIVDLTREVIEGAPPYDPSAALDREQELRLFKHYGRASYWQNDGGK